MHDTNNIEHMFTLPSTPVYYIEYKGARAMMVELFDQYVVLGGSTTTPFETRGCPTNVLNARREAVRQGALRDNAVTRPIFFNSPSAAAGFVMGRAANGWTAWVTSRDVTLDERTRNQGVISTHHIQEGV